MSWLNEPAEWSRAGGELSVGVEPGTDFWRTTHYGFVRDSGHFAYAELTGEASVRFRGEWAAQYDQAGLMLRVDAETWVKAGIERVDGRDWLSVVVTRGLSDWSQQPAPPPDADGFHTIRAIRSGDSVQLLAGDQPIRLAPLPPDVPVLAGAMCAAPEGPGFTAHFTDLTT
jgi:regulation of enolase protein 1 (concanavalin A-like superfamily)